MKLFLILLLIPFSAIHADELIKLETRQGVTQEFIYIGSDNPRANLILLEGGSGVLGLGSLFGSTTINKKTDHLLVKNREAFVENGFSIALVDAPSDMQGKDGMFGRFRVPDRGSVNPSPLGDG